MIGQIEIDFIIKHHIGSGHDLETSSVTFTPWKLYLDGIDCKSGVKAMLLYLFLTMALSFGSIAGWDIFALLTKSNDH